MEEKLEYTELITRFLEKNLNEDELTMLENWLNESYENRKLFDQYNEVWQLGNVVFKEGLYDTDAGWNSLHQKITKNSSVNNKFRIIRTNQLFIWKASTVAAMLIAALFIGLFFQKNIKLPPASQIV